MGAAAAEFRVAEPLNLAAYLCRACTDTPSGPGGVEGPTRQHLLCNRQRSQTLSQPLTLLLPLLLLCRHRRAVRAWSFLPGQGPSGAAGCCNQGECAGTPGSSGGSAAGGGEEPAGVLGCWGFPGLTAGPSFAACLIYLVVQRLQQCVTVSVPADSFTVLSGFVGVWFLQQLCAGRPGGSGRHWQWPAAAGGACASWHAFVVLYR